MIKLIHGDCLELIQDFEDDSIGSIVTDPPYGLSFMGKDWDKALPPIEVWQECYRVLKPGGYIIAMSASRTWHRLAVQLEDLGFIVHPMIGYIYGSGFPKATDLYKQFEKKYCTCDVQKRIREEQKTEHKPQHERQPNRKPKTISKQQNAQTCGTCGKEITEYNFEKWDGWKYGLQSLKPALEPIFVGQKPHLKPMIKNVEKYGVGAMNIESTRVEGKPRTTHKDKNIGMSSHNIYGNYQDKKECEIPNGRHPANLIHDGSESVEAEFLKQSSITKSSGGNSTNIGGFVTAYSDKEKIGKPCGFQDTGTASRFFNSLPIVQDDFIPFLYTAKASKKERGEGNFHSTVKPIKLMEWLVKLVTPPDEVILDPFMGSGTTGIAAKKNGFRFIGIEKEKKYFEIAKERINAR